MRTLNILNLLYFFKNHAGCKRTQIHVLKQHSAGFRTNSEKMKSPVKHNGQWHWQEKCLCLIGYVEIRFGYGDSLLFHKYLFAQFSITFCDKITSGLHEPFSVSW